MVRKDISIRDNKIYNICHGLNKYETNVNISNNYYLLRTKVRIGELECSRAQGKLPVYL